MLDEYFLRWFSFVRLKALLRHPDIVGRRHVEFAKPFFDEGLSTLVNIFEKEIKEMFLREPQIVF